MSYTKEQRLENLKISNDEVNKITKESIQTALLALISKKKLSKISIVELVKKAGVSRASFYNNYESKEEVLKDLSQDLLNILSGTLLFDDEYISNPKKWYEFLFRQIKLNHKWFELVFDNEIDLSNIFISGVELINVSVDPYVLESFKAGLLAIVERWLKTGMKESPTDMAELCAKILDYNEIILKKTL